MTQRESKIKANIDLIEMIVKSNIDQDNVRGAKHALEALDASQRYIITGRLNDTRRKAMGLMTRVEGHRMEMMAREIATLKFDTLFTRKAFA